MTTQSDRDEVEAVPPALGPPKPSVRRWQVAVVVAVSLALYLPAVNNGFFNIDDRALLVDNPHLPVDGLADLLSLVDPSAPLTAQLKAWRPLLLLSYAVEATVFGAQPVAFHVVNVGLYALLCALLLMLLAPLIGRDRAFMSAVLFAAHPAHSEVVCWIAARGDLLNALGALGAFVLYVRGQTLAHRVGALALFALGYAAKPQIVGFLMVLPLYDLTVARRTIGETARRFAPFAAVGAAGVATTLVVGAQLGKIASAVALTDRLAYATLLLGRYVRAGVLPVELSYYHQPFPPLFEVAVEVFGGALLIAAGSFVAFRISRRRGRSVWVLVALFVGALAPVLQLIPFHTFQADRYLLLPSAALILALVIGSETWPPAFRRAVFVVTLVFWSGMTVHRVQIWETSSGVWRDAVASSDAPFAHYQLGRALYSEGDYEAAAVALRVVVDRTPQFVPGALWAGRALREAGELQMAEAFLDDAVRRLGDPGLGVLLGDVAMRRDNPERVIEILAPLAARPDASSYLAWALGRSGRADDADSARCTAERAPLSPEMRDRLDALGVRCRRATSPPVE